MADVKVVWTGLECQVRQEKEDDIFGSVQVIAGMTPQPPLKFPESGTLQFGPPGLRIFSAQRLLYSGPAQDLTVSLALVQHDSGDVEQEKQAVAQAISAAATAAIAKATGGAGGLIKPFIDLVAEALVDFFSQLLGLADNPFNPAAVFIPKDRLLDANSRRQIRQRTDDPRVLQFTDQLACSGTDDDGDLGVYALYLDVQPSGPPAEACPPWTTASAHPH
ncbi:hypothetical protein ACQEV2_41370 [Streptomyces sp. CA-251387]|uniref:hypothetical protein n=1 Tax=Streptomyces sp. CA-251387 TaxID=3240064 RepID=UPI003D89C041